MSPRARRWLAPLLTLCAAVAACGHAQSALSLPAPLWSPHRDSAQPIPFYAREQDGVRIDQLQLKGSHNSYHRAPRLALSRAFRYSHLPIERQLAEQGVRHLEIDVRFAGGQLRVGHAPIVDARTTCRLFDDCIRRVKRWSKAHPQHVPIFVFVQPKEGLAGAQLDDRLELIDHEIRRVFSRHHLLLPSDVARSFPSLRSAVRTLGWPTLESTRGKVAFVLFGTRLTQRYAAGRPRLDGRAMFVAGSSVGAPHTALLSVDDPVARQADIVHAVQEHLLVRTRADDRLARSKRRRDAAIDSGAHFVSSDFVDSADAWLPMSAQAPARLNPRTAPGDGQRVVVEQLEPRQVRVANKR